jgi:hypothetical protein
MTQGMAESGTAFSSGLRSLNEILRNGFHVTLVVPDSLVSKTTVLSIGGSKARALLATYHWLIERKSG